MNLKINKPERISLAHEFTFQLQEGLADCPLTDTVLHNKIIKSLEDIVKTSIDLESLHQHLDKYVSSIDDLNNALLGDTRERKNGDRFCNRLEQIIREFTMRLKRIDGGEEICELGINPEARARLGQYT